MWKIHVSKGSLGHIQLHLPSIKQYTTGKKSSKRIFFGKGQGRAELFSRNWLFLERRLAENFFEQAGFVKRVGEILDAGITTGRVFGQRALKGFFHEERGRDPFRAQGWRLLKQVLARDFLEGAGERPGAAQ